MEILFRGIKTSSGNQTAKLKSIQGLSVFVLEEAEELDDEDTFNTIMQSVRQKGVHNRIILVLNPKSKEHWIYKRFFETPKVDPKFNGEKDGVCYIHTSYLENLENLNQAFIDEAEKCKRNTPALYRYDYLGEWVLSIEGSFLPFEKLKRYDSLADIDGPVVCHFDVADEGTDFTAGIFGKLIDGKFYTFDAVFNQQNLTLNEEVCKSRFDQHNVDRVYVESNSFGQYFIRNLREQNPNRYIYGVLAKSNKLGRIMAQSGWILENIYFPSKPNQELTQFMLQMSSVTPESKDKDDAADSIAGCAMMLRRDFGI